MSHDRDFLAGTGAMHALLRAHDWSDFGPGRPQQWPAWLRAIVQLMLDSNLPMFAGIGGDTRMLYNDAYAELIGDQHPAALGAPFLSIWPETPDDFRAVLERALHGTPTFSRNVEFVLRRGGHAERAWFTFSVSPLRNDDGAVVGVFTTAIDTTAQMRDEHRRLTETERMQRLFRQAPGFIAVLRSPGHVFELANDAFCRLVGQRDLIGKRARDAFPELDGQGFFELLDRVYASGEPYIGRMQPIRVQTQPGGQSEQRFTDFIYQPITEDDGRVTGIFVEGSDVTDSCRMQRQLETLNRQLEDKVDRLEAAERKQAFQLAMADCLRRLTAPADIMAAAAERLGRHFGAVRVLVHEPANDVDGGALAQHYAWPAAEPAIDPASLGPVIGALMRAGTPAAIDDVASDPRTAHHTASHEAVGARASLWIPLLRSGRLAVVLGLLRGQAQPWTGEEVALARDTAERAWTAIESARAQAALRVERDQSQHLFDSMTEGFVMLDRDWTLVRANAEASRISRVAQVDMVGRNHWRLFPEIVGTPLETLLRRVRARGAAESLEYRHRYPTGEQAWIELRVYPALDGRLAIFFRDISARKHGEEELRNADRRKDEFLAMLAHELRNPLAPIAAAAQLLSIARFDEARVRKSSEVIARQVGHMTSLIDDLLDVSRVTRGLVTLNKEALAVAGIVAEAVEQVRPLVEARRHRLDLHLAPDAVWVEGDRKRLIQVLANLLSNAAKYTPENGRIALYMEADAGRVLLSVVDNGIGMPPELVDRVFELFAQAERTSDRSQGGLGIGLAIVRSLVELHGGSVRARSAGPGAGSEFEVILPRLMREPQDAPPRGGVAADAPATGLRVMVVDDNVDAAQMLGLFIETAGHVAEIEHQPRRALERARDLRPDVCLLDIGLPELDGNELARRLRAMPELAQTVLIAVTGYGQSQDRDNAYAAGFDHHFVKPVDTRKLVALLADVARQAHGAGRA